MTVEWFDMTRFRKGSARAAAKLRVATGKQICVMNAACAALLAQMAGISEGGNIRYRVGWDAEKRRVVIALDANGMTVIFKRNRNPRVFGERLTNQLIGLGLQPGMYAVYREGDTLVTGERIGE